MKDHSDADLWVEDHSDVDPWMKERFDVDPRMKDHPDGDLWVEDHSCRSVGERPPQVKNHAVDPQTKDHFL